jgi:hypothetical protein
MNIAAMKTTAAGAAAPRALAPGSNSSVHHGTFAAAMAAADVGRVLPLLPAADTAASRSIEPGSALGALTRQLDELGRHRVQAQTLSDGVAGAWASGIDAPELAVSMHRQARAMASYTVSVMWGAKLIGVTAGALRQLVSAA